jgi:hypothetical protein
VGGIKHKIKYINKKEQDEDWYWYNNWYNWYKLDYAINIFYIIFCFCYFIDNKNDNLHVILI